MIELRNKIAPQLPILVKIAPDLSDLELRDIANVVTRSKVKNFTRNIFNIITTTNNNNNTI
jgi:dihydroorotate dehydrogenase